MQQSFSRYAATAGASLALTFSLAAQRPGHVAEVVPTEHFASKSTPDLAPPPRSVLNEVKLGGTPATPVWDSGLPQPNEGPVIGIDPAKTQSLAGQFRIFRNRDQRPSGSTRLHPGEPSTIANGDTWFATGNTYASLSRDSGQTWSYVNPYTLFPASDGGVCCDQRVIYIPNLDMTVWFIQYRRSATTRTGGFRIAVARSKADLRAGRWFSYYYNTRSFRNLANSGLDQWFDFPDISASRGYLYIASNVFNFSSQYRNSAMIRMRLAGLDGSGSLGTVYYLRSGGSGPMGGGASYRLTQTYNGSRPVSMYWASHNNTSSLKMFRWDDASNARASDVSRSIPAWTSGTGTSVGPDGRSWNGGDDHRIGSGFLHGSEGGFVWSSRHGGSRPQSYIRVCRFRASDRAVLGNHDVWSSTYDFAYPAVGLNSLGHKGTVFSIGSSTRHVTTAAYMVDQYHTTWGGGAFYFLGTGTHGSPSNRWGDYHSVVANRVDTRTFLGTAMRMSGGTSTSRTVHQAVWFGRDDYEPSRVALNVRSTPVTSVPIVVAETDINGRKNGTSNFTRTFMEGQGYTLTAPSTRTSGSNVYLFRSWSGTASSSTRVLSVSNIGSIADTVTANYSLTRRLSVTSNATPTISVSLRDALGRSSGRVPFTRNYASGTPVLTAPSSAVRSGRTLSFYRWEYNGSPQAIGRRTLSVVMTGNRTARAVYGTNVRGSVTRFGTSCRGSAGTPLHTVSGTPLPGANLVYRASSLPAGAPTFLVIGGSNTVWSGIRLPLGLAFIGAPGCSAYVSQDAVLPLPNLIGSASLTLRLPNNSSVIGASVFSQVIVADGRANRLGFTLTNGNQIRIGGWQIP